MPVQLVCYSHTENGKINNAQDFRQWDPSVYGLQCYGLLRWIIFSSMQTIVRFLVWSSVVKDEETMRIFPWLAIVESCRWTILTADIESNSHFECSQQSTGTRKLIVPERSFDHKECEVGVSNHTHQKKRGEEEEEESEHASQVCAWVGPNPT